MNFELITKHFRPRSVLDIGANTGGWHNEARLHWPDAYFFLIEANPACAEMLTMTGASNRIAVLSDTEKDVTFYTRQGAPTCTGASYKRELTTFYSDDAIIPQTMRTQRLADVVEGHVFDLIKLDTQGSELEIINGGLDIVKAAKGVIMELSFIEYNQGAPLAPEVCDFMAKLGFFQAEALGDIVHPLGRNVIQRDVLFLKS
jgi:FkbM family methyltransferase